jgi:hypothetical protein
MPVWLIAIGVIVVLQTVTATLSRLLPVISPAFMAEFFWDETWIGYLSAASVIGSLFVLTAGIGLVRNWGGVRALQISLLVGAASLVLFNVPSLAVALLASIALGLSNGPPTPRAARCCSASRRRPTATSCSRSSRPAFPWAAWSPGLPCRGWSRPGAGASR